MITDADGLPLVVHTTPANLRDDMPALQMVRAMPPIQGPRGRPRRKPHALVGDRGYGFPWIISAIIPIATIGIEPLLCPRGSEHGPGAPGGRRRYVVERTLAWFPGAPGSNQAVLRKVWRALSGLS